MDEGDTVWEPERAFVPLQPPDAVQVVAFDELHDSVVLAPATMLVGLAVNVSAGAGGGGAVPTVTVTVFPTLPPAPVQDRPKDVVAVSGPVPALPLVGLVPLQPPLAVQAVAFSELHVSVAADPAWTLDGFAASVSVGAGGADATTTLAERLSDPPAPVQVSW